MKIASAMIAATALAISPPVPPTTWEQDVEILGGVFWGIMEVEHWSEMQTCAKDADLFAAEVL
jgi:hypothetical protein